MAGAPQRLAGRLKFKGWRLAVALAVAALIGGLADRLVSGRQVCEREVEKVVSALAAGADATGAGRPSGGPPSVAKQAAGAPAGEEGAVAASRLEAPDRVLEFGAIVRALAQMERDYPGTLSWMARYGGKARLLFEANRNSACPRIVPYMGKAACVFVEPLRVDPYSSEVKLYPVRPGLP